MQETLAVMTFVNVITLFCLLLNNRIKLYIIITYLVNALYFNFNTKLYCNHTNFNILQVNTKFWNKNQLFYKNQKLLLSSIPSVLLKSFWFLKNFTPNLS